MVNLQLRSIFYIVFIQVSGEVSYNECKLDDLNSQKISAYISQYDLDTPEMTVRETIDFSARCQGVESRKGILNMVLNFQLHRIKLTRIC